MITHGIEVPPAEMRPVRAPDPTAPFRLLYLGRLVDEEKGVFLLPAILRACRAQGINATLTIAGDGKDQAELKALCRAQGVDQYISWRGPVLQSETQALYLQHEVLLLPSYTEGLGLVLLEAQACGCVPIATRISQVTDFAVVDGETGILVERGDAAAFAKSVALLAAQPGTLNALCRRGREHIIESFSTGRMLDEYERLFDEALAGAFPLPASRATLPPIDYSIFYLRHFMPQWLWQAIPPSLLQRYGAHKHRKEGAR
jgi:glycosyltransferase involved in cell wall biosynthesis